MYFAVHNYIVNSWRAWYIPIIAVLSTPVLRKLRQENPSIKASFHSDKLSHEKKNTLWANQKPTGIEDI